MDFYGQINRPDVILIILVKLNCFQAATLMGENKDCKNRELVSFQAEAILAEDHDGLCQE